MDKDWYVKEKATYKNLYCKIIDSFIGEILVLISIFSVNFKVALLISTSMVFSAIYSL
jgi:NADH:ubiquinone oxidoreductase subunit 4 (subunit M)